MIERWKQLSTVNLVKTPYLSLRKDKCLMPDGKEVPNYYVIDTSEWANVIAIDKEGMLVMVRQYRYAGDEICLEFPGGMCEGEEPQAAVLRELFEETGYRAGSCLHLGSHRPNPALQSNFLHSYIATDCVCEGEQKLDPHEDIEVVRVSVDDVSAMIRKGEFTHSLMLATFMLALPHFKNKGF